LSDKSAASSGSQAKRVGMCTFSGSTIIYTGSKSFLLHHYIQTDGVFH